MPEHTIDIIRRRAEDCGIPAFGDLAEFKMRAGMAKFGPESHLSGNVDGLREGLDELADMWAYFAIEERNGRRLPEEVWTMMATLAGMAMVLVECRDRTSDVVKGGGS